MARKKKPKRPRPSPAESLEGSEPSDTSDVPVNVSSETQQTTDTTANTSPELAAQVRSFNALLARQNAALGDLAITSSTSPGDEDDDMAEELRLLAAAEEQLRRELAGFDMPRPAPSGEYFTPTTSPGDQMEAEQTTSSPPDLSFVPSTLSYQSAEEEVVFESDRPLSTPAASTPRRDWPSAKTEEVKEEISAVSSPPRSSGPDSATKSVEEVLNQLVASPTTQESVYSSRTPSPEEVSPQNVESTAGIQLPGLLVLQGATNTPRIRETPGSPLPSQVSSDEGEEEESLRRTASVTTDEEDEPAEIEVTPKLDSQPTQGETGAGVHSRATPLASGVVSPRPVPAHSPVRTMRLGGGAFPEEKVSTEPPTSRNLLASFGQSGTAASPTMAAASGVATASQSQSLASTPAQGDASDSSTPRAETQPSGEQLSVPPETTQSASRSGYASAVGSHDSTGQPGPAEPPRGPQSKKEYYTQAQKPRGFFSRLARSSDSKPEAQQKENVAGRQAGGASIVGDVGVAAVGVAGAAAASQPAPSSQGTQVVSSDSRPVGSAAPQESEHSVVDQTQPSIPMVQQSQQAPTEVSSVAVSQPTAGGEGSSAALPSKPSPRVRQQRETVGAYDAMVQPLPSQQALRVSDTSKAPTKPLPPAPQSAPVTPPHLQSSPATSSPITGPVPAAQLSPRSVSAPATPSSLQRVLSTANRSADISDLTSNTPHIAAAVSTETEDRTARPPSGDSRVSPSGGAEAARRRVATTSQQRAEESKSDFAIGQNERAGASLAVGVVRSGAPPTPVSPADDTAVSTPERAMRLSRSSTPDGSTPRTPSSITPNAARDAASLGLLDDTFGDEVTPITAATPASEAMTGDGTMQYQTLWDSGDNTPDSSESATDFGSRDLAAQGPPSIQRLHRVGPAAAAATAAILDIQPSPPVSVTNTPVPVSPTDESHLTEPTIDTSAPVVPDTSDSEVTSTAAVGEVSTDFTPDSRATRASSGKRGSVTSGALPPSLRQGGDGSASDLATAGMTAGAAYEYMRARDDVRGSDDGQGEPLLAPVATPDEEDQARRGRCRCLLAFLLFFTASALIAVPVSLMVTDPRNVSAASGPDTPSAFVSAAPSVIATVPPSRIAPEKPSDVPSDIPSMMPSSSLGPTSSRAPTFEPSFSVAPSLASSTPTVMVLDPTPTPTKRPATATPSPTFLASSRPVPNRPIFVVSSRPATAVPTFVVSRPSATSDVPSQSPVRQPMESVGPSTIVPQVPSMRPALSSRPTTTPRPSVLQPSVPSVRPSLRPSAFGTRTPASPPQLPSTVTTNQPTLSSSPILESPSLSPTELGSPPPTLPSLLPVEMPTVSAVTASPSPAGTVQRPSPSPGVPTTSRRPTTFDEELFNFLASISPDGGAALADPTSPQARAFAWLSSNTGLETYSQERIVTRYTLATFYYSTTGEDWLVQTNWMTNEDECRWFTRSARYPACDRSGNFERLELYYNNLAGTIPSELSLLSDTLFCLHISGGPTNRLDGTIPSWLGTLTGLQELRFANNDLSGTLPSEIGRLTDLKALDGSNNTFTGSLFSEVGQLTSLQWLELEGNKIGGELPSELGDAEKLKIIRLDDNLLQGSIPFEIGQLSRLDTLTMRNNQLTALTEGLGDLSHLKILSLTSNTLQGTLPDLSGLTDLQVMSLAENQLTGTLPEWLGDLKNLRDGLDLSSNKFTGPIPERLADIDGRIRVLLLDHNRLSGQVPATFVKLSSLNQLRLDNNDLTGTMPVDVCRVFNKTLPAVYVDCDELECPCCSFCCRDGGGCQCRYKDTTEEWKCYH